MYCIIVLYTVLQFHRYYTSIYAQKTDNAHLEFYIRVNKRTIFQENDRQQEKLLSDGYETQFAQRRETP